MSAAGLLAIRLTTNQVGRYYMLDIISKGFQQAKDSLQGKATLTTENIKEAVSSIRQSLLEADVEYGVAKDFLKKVEQEAIGRIIETKAGSGGQKLRVKPADHFIQICQTELEDLMGPENTDIELVSNRPTVIMMVGLQGAGKTTTTAKLANFLIEAKKQKPLLVAADIYRPAAVEQLRVLGKQLDTSVYHDQEKSPVVIAEQAVQQAFNDKANVVLVDTAGRLTLDTDLMQELKDIKKAVNPDEVLFVCDAMMGQDAVTTAKAFHEEIGLTGFIMTKLDGDARGGAALSIKKVTGVPIKFLGIGEDIKTGLEVFRPKGLASRILGMGDVVGLMQDFERVASDDQEEDALRMLQGQFSFDDFYEQISMIQKMGSLKDIAAKLPMQNMIPKGANLDDGELSKVKSMIQSMTKMEKVKPTLFNPSRVKRVARGSGRSEKEVMDLIQKFSGMRKMMGGLGKSMGLMGKIPGMKGLSQLNQMRKMAKGLSSGNPSAAGGMGDMGALMQQMAGGGAMKMPGSSSTKKVVDRDKQKKLRKQAKKNRKKNRKK